MNIDKETNLPVVSEYQMELPAYSPEEIEKWQKAHVVVGHVRNCFTEAKYARQPYESRWLDSYRQYRGVYSAEQQQQFELLAKHMAMPSKIFAKVTKTKVESFFGQLIQILFADNEFPLELSPTPIPTGVAERGYIDVEAEDVPDTQSLGYSGDGLVVPPGTTSARQLGPYRQKLGKLINKFRPGVSDDPNKPELKPAEIAGINQTKRIQDQLTECKARREVEDSLKEMCILGTGAIMGPISEYKDFPTWLPDDEGLQLKSNYELVPKIKHVSIWDLYPEPNKKNLDDCSWLVHRMNYSASQMRGLLAQKLFNPHAINRCLDTGNQRDQEYFESQLQDSNYTARELDEYTIYRYWGYITKSLGIALGLDVDTAADVAGRIQVDLWVCGNEVLRATVNPFKPHRIPYNIVCLEKLPYQIWGVGIPENMEDAQDIMNGAMRGAADNLKLAGSLIFEVNTDFIDDDEDFAFYPGKVIHNTSGAMGQAVRAFKFPSTANENMVMFDKASQLADVATGIYSYTHGGGGIPGSTRAAASVSMMMNAASIGIKQVLMNIDADLMEPLGECLFNWNMQYRSDDIDIQGDLQVVAKGKATAMLERELVSQKLLALMQTSLMNETLAKEINFRKIMKLYIKSLDLPKEDVLNSPDEAQQYLKMVREYEIQRGTAQAGTAPGTQSSGGLPSNSGTLPTANGLGNEGPGAIGQRPTGPSGQVTNAVQIQ